LATVFGIVQQHNGQILVYSESGRGTTFNIYLPAITEVSGGGVVETESEGIPRGTELVLVVEDEIAVRDLACYMLRRQGYKVVEASNGEEALRLGPTTDAKN
jgi:hypothetical protein